ncbi:MAG: dihydrodipicolinate synthase family protein [Maribacter sp.]|nr:dihydrodipicolinate synthase family protein [Maribacter sp.]
MNRPLQGIIPPMVTPLLENGHLDRNGLQTLVEHMLQGGIHGLFLLGTTGEGPSLSHKIRKQLISEACALVNKRVPVLVGITDTSAQESIVMAEYSEKAGADVVVVAPPYYLPIAQDEMQNYLDYLAPKLPLPFMLYNMPSCTKLHLSIETISMAKELGAIGIKDSSGDREYLTTLIQEFKDDPNFSIFTGIETLMVDALKMGGHGAVPGGANFFPRLYVDLYEACLKRETDQIVLLNKQVQWISDTLYTVGKHASKYILGTKCALAALGICQDYVLPPLQRFEAADRARIKSFLAECTYYGDFNIRL